LPSLWTIAYCIKDTAVVLAKPEVWLALLQEEMREVKALMGYRRLLLYQIRSYPIRVAILAYVVTALVYQQRFHPLVAPVLAMTKIAWVKFGMLMHCLGRKIGSLVVH
jgi:hypothetical protein